MCPRSHAPSTFPPVWTFPGHYFHLSFPSLLYPWRLADQQYLPIPPCSSAIKPSLHPHMHGVGVLQGPGGRGGKGTQGADAYVIRCTVGWLCMEPGAHGEGCTWRRVHIRVGAHVAGCAHGGMCTQGGVCTEAGACVGGVCTEAGVHKGGWERCTVGWSTQNFTRAWWPVWETPQSPTALFSLPCLIMLCWSCLSTVCQGWSSM